MTTYKLINTVDFLIEFRDIASVHTIDEHEFRDSRIKKMLQRHIHTGMDIVRNRVDGFRHEVKLADKHLLGFLSDGFDELNMIGRIVSNDDCRIKRGFFDLQLTYRYKSAGITKITGFFFNSRSYIIIIPIVNITDEVRILMNDDCVQFDIYLVKASGYQAFLNSTEGKPYYYSIAVKAALEMKDYMKYDVAFSQANQLSTEVGTIWKSVLIGKADAAKSLAEVQAKF